MGISVSSLASKSVATHWGADTVERVLGGTSLNAEHTTNLEELLSLLEHSSLGC